jgi:hypothetical protein
MKGPGFRVDLDVRRLWECPACGRRLKMPGDVTNMSCDCRGPGSEIMRLIECLHKAESPFDHVGFAAQKRIDAAIRKPFGPDEPHETSEAEPDASVESACDVVEHADRRPPDSDLPETTGEIDADAPPPTYEEPPPE